MSNRHILNTHRGTGRTTRMLEDLAAEIRREGAGSYWLVCANSQHGHQLERTLREIYGEPLPRSVELRVVAARQMRERLRGCRGRLAWDHFALEDVFTSFLEDYGIDATPGVMEHLHPRKEIS